MSKGDKQGRREVLKEKKKLGNERRRQGRKEGEQKGKKEVGKEKVIMKGGQRWEGEERSGKERRRQGRDEDIGLGGE